MTTYNLGNLTRHNNWSDNFENRNKICVNKYQNPRQNVRNAYGFWRKMWHKIVVFGKILI